MRRHAGYAPVGARAFVVYTPWDEQTMVSHASGG